MWQNAQHCTSNVEEKKNAESITIDSFHLLKTLSSDVFGFLLNISIFTLNFPFLDEIAEDVSRSVNRLFRDESSFENFK